MDYANVIFIFNLQQILQECVIQMEHGTHLLLLPTTGVQKTLQVSHISAMINLMV